MLPFIKLRSLKLKVREARRSYKDDVATGGFYGPPQVRSFFGQSIPPIKILKLKVVEDKEDETKQVEVDIKWLPFQGPPLNEDGFRTDSSDADTVSESSEEGEQWSMDGGDMEQDIEEESQVEDFGRQDIEAPRPRRQSDRIRQAPLEEPLFLAPSSEEDADVDSEDEDADLSRPIDPDPDTDGEDYHFAPDTESHGSDEDE